MYNTLIKASNDMDYIGEVRKRMTLSTSQLCHESLKERLKGGSMLFAV